MKNSMGKQRMLICAKAKVYFSVQAGTVVTSLTFKKNYQSTTVLSVTSLNLNKQNNYYSQKAFTK